MISNDPVDKQFAALGYKPDYPPDTIRGVPLNDAQYDDYVRYAGKLSKGQLESLIAHPQWNAVPDAQKLPIMKAVIDRARDIAQTAIMMKSQGSDNDIMRKATEVKTALLESQAGQPQAGAETEGENSSQGHD